MYTLNKIKLYLILLTVLLTACETSAIRNDVLERQKIVNEKEIIFNYIPTWSVTNALSEEIITTEVKVVTFVFLLDGLWKSQHADAVEELQDVARSQLRNDNAHLVVFTGIGETGELVTSSSRKILGALFPTVASDPNIDNYRAVIVSSELVNPFFFRARIKKYLDKEYYVSSETIFSSKVVSDNNLQAVLKFGLFSNNNCVVRAFNKEIESLGTNRSFSENEMCDSFDALAEEFYEKFQKGIVIDSLIAFISTASKLF